MNWDTGFETDFNYSMNTDCVKQGAEARIYECLYLGRFAVLKERFPKQYRHPVLDKQLNKARLKSELKGIRKAGQLGVNSPTVYFVDGDNNRFIMERVIGKTAKEWIENERRNRNRKDFVQSTSTFGRILGVNIGKMHFGGLVHGDLTTSNMILRDEDVEKIVFLDFGLCNLGKITPEDKGVDMYVLERAIQSTHLESDHIMEAVLGGYKSVNMRQGEAVFKKLDEIRMRGRKRDMIG